MTYGDNSTTSLQSLELYFSLCNATNIKEVRKMALNDYAKWLTLHELGHYLYYIKDTKAENFETICWEGDDKKCKDEDFISEYAQTNKYEDYAEQFAYRYLMNKQKEKPLWKPSDPNSVKFQEKMRYFSEVF
jgi:Zn-dependent peptidase ImmA (M78 family)